MPGQPDRLKLGGGFRRCFLRLRQFRGVFLRDSAKFRHTFNSRFKALGDGWRVEIEIAHALGVSGVEDP